jgi:hypothetical protein
MADMKKTYGLSAFIIGVLSLASRTQAEPTVTVINHVDAQPTVFQIIAGNATGPSLDVPNGGKSASATLAFEAQAAFQYRSSRSPVRTEWVKFTSDYPTLVMSVSGCNLPRRVSRSEQWGASLLRRFYLSVSKAGEITR